ncbi:MAG: hypothetical protein MJ132_04030, partial [Clostridia bacterium]|nr:hypothetical protein [Clostridia bacterium]
MNENLYQFILNKEHHQYRHTVDWDLAGEYAEKEMPAAERMADRFERMTKAETPVILPDEQIVF